MQYEIMVEVDFAISGMAHRSMNVRTEAAFLASEKEVMSGSVPMVQSQSRSSGRSSRRRFTQGRCENVRCLVGAGAAAAGLSNREKEGKWPF